LPFPLAALALALGTGGCFPTAAFGGGCFPIATFGAFGWAAFLAAAALAPFFPLPLPLCDNGAQVVIDFMCLWQYPPVLSVIDRSSYVWSLIMR
jgi:hypothetical protein